MTRLPFLAVCLLLSLAAVDCQSDRETAPGKDSAQIRQQRTAAFRRQMEARMKVLEQRIEDLRQNVETGDTRLRAELRQEYENAAARLKQLQDRVPELEPEAEAALKETKSTFESAIDELESWCRETERRLNP
jgi:chromosome segregation ATPase